MLARSVVRGGLVAAVAVLSWPAAHIAARASQKQDQKSIFVSVLDDAGKPVTDLTANEFALREDGKDCQIVNAGPAQAPLNVVLLVDTNNSAIRLTQNLHTAVLAFIKELHAGRPDAEIELMEFGQAPVATTPFITGDLLLEKALDRMVPKSGADSVLMEAIAQANGNLAKRPSPRRAIVSLNVDPSNEQLGDRTRIAQSFVKTGSELWALSLQQNDVTFTTAATDATGCTAVATAVRNGGNPDAPAVPCGENSSAAANATNVSASRNALLEDLARASGGTHDMIDAPTTMETVLRQWADALASQYEITYIRDAASAKVVQVGTTRTGVHLHASGFAPQ